MNKKQFAYQTGRFIDNNYIPLFLSINAATGLALLYGRFSLLSYGIASLFSIPPVILVFWANLMLNLEKNILWDILLKM